MYSSDAIVHYQFPGSLMNPLINQLSHRIDKQLGIIVYRSSLPCIINFAEPGYMKLARLQDRSLSFDISPAMSVSVKGVLHDRFYPRDIR
jgi:hypothetical protein